MVKVSLFTIHDNVLFVGTSVQHPWAEPNNPSKDWEVEASCLGKDPTFQAVQVFKMARMQQQMQPKFTVPSRNSMWEFDWKHAWMNNSCMEIWFRLYFSSAYKDFFVHQFHSTIDNQVRLKLPPCTRVTRQHRGLPGEFHLLSVFLSTILSLQMVAVDIWYFKGIWQRDVQPGRSL